MKTINITSKQIFRIFEMTAYLHINSAENSKWLMPTSDCAPFTSTALPETWKTLEEFYFLQCTIMPV
jgi:hypothetical protein